MNLALATDVSWRSPTGPRATIRLIDYADAIETAEALAMVIEGDVAHLSERTPDLAEAALSRTEKQKKTEKAHA